MSTEDNGTVETNEIRKLNVSYKLPCDWIERMEHSCSSVVCIVNVVTQ